MTTSPVRLERRAGQRFDLHLPVSVKLTGSTHEACGFTQDLSARGSFFYTDYPLGAGESIELTLVMPSEITLGENMRVRCRGQVLRVLQPSVGTKLGIAVHFAGYEYLTDAATLTDTADFQRVSSLHSKPEDEPLPVLSSARTVAAS
jgi:PilZ domain